MIIDERMSAFIDSLDSGNPAWLNEIEKFALETQVPIIRRSMQSLLKFLLKFTKPKSILEVGTAIGFSALLMSEYAPEDCHITTIEKYEKRIPIAKENFRKAVTRRSWNTISVSGISAGWKRYRESKRGSAWKKNVWD